MPEVDFDRNVTALYDAIGKSDWEEASRAVQDNPIEAETWVVRRDRGDADVGELEDKDDPAAVAVADDVDNNILWRFLPLHSACARRPPSNFLRDLLQAYPTAASLRDGSGMHPLHYACGNRASLHVIEQLVEAYPQAVKECDPSQGMLPLHYVAQFGQSEDGILDLLLNEYAEGVTVLNAEGHTPIDLCRESNFDGWDDMLLTMKKKKRELGLSSGSQHSNKALDVSTPHEVGQKSDRDDSLVLSTIEIRTNKRSSSRSRRGRSSSRSRGASDAYLEARDEKIPSSRSQRSSSGSRRDRSSLNSRGGRASIKQLDTRDEISTPRSRGEVSTPRSRGEISISRSDPSGRKARSSVASSVSGHSILSFDNLSLENRPRSINPCSLASPRYHDMKTPRSSGGRGPGFFGCNTPRSSRRSVHSADFDYNNDVSIEGSTLHENPSGVSTMRSVAFDFDHDTSLRGGIIQENHHGISGPSMRPLQQLREQEAQHHHMIDQLVARHSNEKDNMEYQVTLLKSENTLLREENAQLQAKLANYETIQKENAKLCDTIDKLNSIQGQLKAIVGSAGERENSRIKASSQRRKMLLEMLAAEEKQDQDEKTNWFYQGEVLEKAIEQQVNSIGGIREEVMRHFRLDRSQGGRDTSIGLNHQFNTGGYMVNSASP